MLEHRRGNGALVACRAATAPSAVLAADFDRRCDRRAYVPPQAHSARFGRGRSFVVDPPAANEIIGAMEIQALAKDLSADDAATRTAAAEELAKLADGAQPAAVALVK